MIDTPLLRQLIHSGKAGDLVAKVATGGFVLAMREGTVEQLLEVQRGGPRTFKRLEAVASYLSALGADKFSVELSSPVTPQIKICQPIPIGPA